MRYLRQLLILPVMPILMLVYSGGQTSGPLFALSGLLVGFFAGVLAYTDVSYDGTAFATVLQTGITGRDDRLGRMLGAATVSVPLVLIIDVATVAIAGRWDLLPAVLGASLALTLVGLGVSAVSSALLVVPTPAPGDSPFKRVPGSTFSMFLAFLLCWGLVAVVSLPAVVPAIISTVTGSATAGWLALGIGPCWASRSSWSGSSCGGRTFDASAPRLLAQLRTFQGA